MNNSLRHLACQTYLHTFGFATLAIAVTSLGGYFLDESNLFLSLLLPDSLISVMLMGMGVLAYAMNRPVLVKLAASLLLAVALYSLLGNLLGHDSDPDRSLISGFQRMPNAIAALFILSASGLLCAQAGQRGRRLLWALAALVVGLGLISQLASAFPALANWKLAIHVHASGVANLFALLAGGALLCLAIPPVKGEDPLDPVTLATGCLCILLSSTGWYLLSRNNDEATRHNSELLRDKTGVLIEEASEAKLLAIRRMTARWRALGELPPDPLWREETRDYLRDFYAFDTFALIDTKLQPKHLSSRSVAETEELYRLLTQPELRNWLQALPHNGMAQATTVNKPNEGPHSLIAIPLDLPGWPGWTLVASVDVSRILAPIIGPAVGGYHLRVLEGERLLFESVSSQANVGDTPIGETTIRGLGDVNWRLVSYLRSSASTYLASYLPSLLLLFGLTLSFVVMFSQRLRRLAVGHAQQLRQINQTLEHSLLRQASLQHLNLQIMHHSQSFLCSIDAQGRYTEVNSACYALLGYRPEELIGQPYLNFILPEDRPLDQETARRAMNGEPVQDIHSRYRHKNGRVVHLLWSYAWSASEHNFFAAGHDITQVLQSEAYLEDQRDILGMITTNQALPEIFKAICHMVEAQESNGLCSVLRVDDAQQHLLLGAAPSLPQAYNQAVEGIAIGPSSGSCGTAVYRRQLVIVEDIASNPLWRDFRELALEHGLRACWSFPLIASDNRALGSLAIYHQQSTTPTDEHLQLIANAAQLATIAIEREQDREHLLASEQRFRSLFTFTPSAAVALNLKGQIESLNQAASELLGQEAELIDKHFSHCFPQELLSEVNQHFAQACTGESHRFETQCIGLCGGKRDLSITFLPIKVSDAIVGVFAIARDISQRKKTQEQLNATLQELQRSNQELQEFAFVASHDLQEPLRKIQTFAERLGARADGLDTQGRDYLERMTAAAGRMQTLIRDLLDYSRISTRGKAFETVDTEQTLDGVLRDMEVTIASSGAQILREPLPPIHGDPTQIRQLLQNLLSNAIKFHKDAQPPHIRIYAERKEGDEWSLCVEDQGIGFDEKYLDRIFNPFQRLHGRGAYPGTGIGLAIVKKIVERHGARISASSKPGRGSLFRTTFATNREE